MQERKISKNGTWNSVKGKVKLKDNDHAKKYVIGIATAFYKLFDLQKVHNVIVFFSLPIKKDRHGGIELDYFRTITIFATFVELLIESIYASRCDAICNLIALLFDEEYFAFLFILSLFLCIAENLNAD